MIIKIILSSRSTALINSTNSGTIAEESGELQKISTDGKNAIEITTFRENAKKEIFNKKTMQVIDLGLRYCLLNGIVRVSFYT